MAEFQVGQHPATPEQEVIIKQAIAGESFKVVAFAGSSKTTTLMALSQQLTFKKILYLAFNRAIADEARQIFPNWVVCRTAHSLGYHYVVGSSQSFKQKLSAGSSFIPYQDLEKYSEKPANWRPFGRSRYQVNLAISETLQKFLNSAEAKVSMAHIPDEILSWGNNSAPQIIETFVSQLITYTQNLALAMFDENSPCAMSHDAYLKLFQLRKPQLDFDVILLDEAQDTNPVLQAIFANQNCQKILVGDRHQEIYAWRSAVNTLDKVNLPEYPLTHSFRFGDKIAEVANRLLQFVAEPRKIVGRGEDFKVNANFDQHQPYAVICRTNAKVFEVADFCVSRNLSYCINGGLDQISRLISSAYGLYKDNFKLVRSSELALFSSWDEFKTITEELNKAEWKTIIKFIETHQDKSLDKIEALAKGASFPRQAQVFISTAHRAKGLGFRQVALASDFEWPDDSKPGYKESLNVIYVALTRAEQVLVLPKGLREKLTPIAS